MNVCTSSELLAILLSAKNTCNRHCAQLSGCWVRYSFLSHSNNNSIGIAIDLSRDL